MEENKARGINKKVKERERERQTWIKEDEKKSFNSHPYN